MPIARHTLPLLLGSLAVVLSGCNNSTTEVNAEADDHGHDHHDHSHGPESLSDAVADLIATRDTIRDAITSGKPSAAHGPLHEVAHLLEAIPDLAAETDLSEKEWKAVNDANEQLLDGFGTIDKAFHTKDGDKKAAYEQVAQQIDEAIEAIKSRLVLTGEEPEHTGHDHDDHDEEEEVAASEDAS